MPAGAPFTRLCQELGRPPQFGRADLHLHTTASDGLYSPAELVDLARRSGLSAVAITDHDTCDGVAAARQSAGPALEVIAGVEATAEHRGKELHLLGLFIRLDDSSLANALAKLRQDRVHRFQEMIERLEAMGVRLDMPPMSDHADSTALGRRHLAELLVKAGRADTVRHAFQRYLGDRGRVAVPKRCLPVREAIELVRGAGGVAAWAHPTYDCTHETLRELHGFGMRALEVAFPSCRPGRERALRTVCKELGLAVTGGSDCHGPDQPHRAVGARGVTRDELDALRERCAC